jgi:lysine 2,3-aminomutase
MTDQPFAITPALDALIDRDDPHDPIARQFLPDARERNVGAEEMSDPIGDDRFSPVKGIVHRYTDRVLLKPTLACPAYCRFCFRREVVGQGDTTLTAAELDAAFAYIEAHAEIWEVIVSGGDPLALSPRRLGAIVRRLDAIPYVEVIRVHTRVPVADPERIDDAMIAALRAEKPVYVVVHCNHAKELSEAARAALARLADAGHPLLAQTVLLKGINDDTATLEALMRALVRNRIKPYYLHHADLAPGTAHFRTSLADGQAIMASLRGRVSGLCQPTYVLDIPGGHGKVPVGPCYAAGPDGAGAFLITDPNGCPHSYANAPPPVASQRPSW